MRPALPFNVDVDRFLATPSLTTTPLGSTLSSQPIGTDGIGGMLGANTRVILLVPVFFVAVMRAATNLSSK